MLWRALLGLSALALAGCASYASRIVEPRWQLEQGKYDSAIKTFKDLADKEDNDQLLYLMDLGIANYRAKRYVDAIDAFTKADRLAEMKDYTSVSQEVGSVILNGSLRIERADGDGGILFLKETDLDVVKRVYVRITQFDRFL